MQLMNCRARCFDIVLFEVSSRAYPSVGTSPVAADTIHHQVNWLVPSAGAGSARVRFLRLLSGRGGRRVNSVP